MTTALSLDDIFYKIINDKYVDPRPLYDEIRRQTPVYRTPFGIWWVMRYDIGHSVYTDRSKWTVDPSCSATGAIHHPESFVMQTWARNLVVSDGEKHRRLNALVRDLFRPNTIKAMHERVKATIDDQLREFGDREEIELRFEFAEFLPTRIILDLLGIAPQHLHLFADVAEALARAMEPNVSDEQLGESDAIWRSAAEVVTETANERRAEPRDDLMTTLVQAAADGDRLTEDELISMVLLLTVAGQETTGQMMCSGLYHLLCNPDQLAAVRADRSLLPGMIEEALRYDSATRVSGIRYALQDIEIGGQKIARGEGVMVCLQAANHDPAAFEDPLRFNIFRDNARHLGFGVGPHHCLGSALARMELGIVWDSILDRYSSIEVDENLAWKPRFMVRGLELLPLRVQRAEEAVGTVAP